MMSWLMDLNWLVDCKSIGLHGWFYHSYCVILIFWIQRQIHPKVTQVKSLSAVRKPLQVFILLTIYHWTIFYRQLQSCQQWYFYETESWKEETTFEKVSMFNINIDSQIVHIETCNLVEKLYSIFIYICTNDKWQK